ncbi:shikimate dehydrogenase [Thauera phenylacetica B4P]|uniref:Shikimate dehydrogenase n=1 Tax=Thauera phenylacetica B4P TaxID=1234382 RepID=N6ZT24_9RHOO|nr:shikimate dehydrogenase [Thauera phenylacetica]ENO97453.1 shikimate dehydrogenase [Thauera phenylacetica B4P]
MIKQLNGESRVFFIVGDPIAQVKSPYAVTVELQKRGVNGVCVPAHIAPVDLGDAMRTFNRMQNVHGIIATVPHKFSAFDHCKSGTERANFLQASNVIRRGGDGSWHGDMVDGLAMAAAIERKGHTLRDRKALLVGAGGAGTAIGHALLSAGVASLVVHDTDSERRDRLIAKLASLNLGTVGVGSVDPSANDIVVNATPLGMREGDPYPFDVGRIQSGTIVGDVITVPAVSPLIAAARGIGCPTVTGLDMFAEVSGLMIDFLLET